MTIQVVERPPLRLITNVQSPDGSQARWAQDARDPRYVPNGQTMSTAMPGGFDSYSCTLQRDPRRSYPDLEPLSTITVYGPGGGVAWQGRLDATPDVSGTNAQVSPQAGGYQGHLQDQMGAMVFVDQSLSSWSDPPQARLESMITATPVSKNQGAWTVGTDPINGVPSLTETVQGGWTTGGGFEPIVEVWYDSGDAQPIAKVAYNFSSFGLSGMSALANWKAVVAITSDPADATEQQSPDVLNTGPASGVFAPATAQRYAILRINNSATSGTNGTGNVYWKGIAAYGNHNLPLYGTSPQGLLASDVIAFIIQQWCPLIGFSTGAIGTIQDSSFIIPQLAFTSLTSPADMITQAASFEVLDWAVWEGPTFWCNARDAVGNLWKARAGPAQLQNAGAQSARIFNGVVVVYTDVSGTTLTVGPPGSTANITDASLLDSDPANPANQVVDSGGNTVPRWGVVQMGDATSAMAIKTGGQFLAAQREADSSGSAVLTGHVQDQYGVWWPAWKVRAGDQISFVDAHDTSYRRIVSTTYDDSAKANSIQLDQPPDTMTALLERLSIVLTPGGLS